MMMDYEITSSRLSSGNVSMALNPYFLQGSHGVNKDLVQSLINEHLKIYGQEVTYIPRKYVRSRINY